MKHVAIFTEGGPGVGMGHLSRCSAVVEQLLQVGLSVQVYIQGPSDSVGLFPDAPSEIVSWTEEPLRCRSLFAGCNAVVFDSYRPSSQFYRAALSGYPGVPVFFDDLGSPPLDWGIVVNGAADATRLYGSHPAVRALAGMNYQAVRSAFLSAPRRECRSAVQEIVVVLGGDDVHRLAPVIYESLSEVGLGWSLTLVTTRNSRTFPDLQLSVVAPHRLVVNASASEMRDEFLRADLAISAAGQTTFEMAITGLPAVLIPIAENQSEVVRAWARLGYARTILSVEEVGIPQTLLQALRGMLPQRVRQEVADRGQASVDGLGALRIAQAIAEAVANA